MCNFISWIEYKDEILYMTDRDLETSRGKKLSRDIGFEDIAGHGAIRSFFNIPDGKGTDRESTDFSTPDNFPQDIVRDVKKGLFTQYGVALQILTPPALAEYLEIEQSALAEYLKIEQSTLAEYLKIRHSAWAKYEEIEQSALAEYLKIKHSAWTEYLKIKHSALAEYEKIKHSTLAEYEKIEQPTLAEYLKIRQSAFWELAKIKKNRVKAWQ